MAELRGEYKPREHHANDSSWLNLQRDSKYNLLNSVKCYKFLR